MDKFKTILLIVIIAFLVGVLGLGFYYVNAVIEGNKVDTHKVENVQDKKPNFEEVKQEEENSNVNEKDLDKIHEEFLKTDVQKNQNDYQDNKMTFLKSYSVGATEEITDRSTFFYVIDYTPAKNLLIDKLYLKGNESCPILIEDNGNFKMSSFNTNNPTYFRDFNNPDDPMVDLDGKLPRKGNFKANKFEKGSILIGCKIDPKKSKLVMGVQNRTEEYDLW